MSDDPFDLERFVEAQNTGDAYTQALRELRAGRKTSHWVWFVFPQIEGLGRSPMAQRYALSSLDEARAYLAHPVLGPRLHSATQTLTAHTDRDAETVLGAIDAMKLRSSMTLFKRAAPDEPLFERILAQWFGGVEDPETARRV